MAVWLYPTQTPGLNLYSFIYNGSGEVWNGTDFVTFSTGSWAVYAVTTTELGSSGTYAITIPSDDDFVNGTYTVVVYERDGGSPASSDTADGSGTEVWDGGTTPEPDTLPTPAGEAQPPAPLASSLSSQPFRLKVNEVRFFSIDFDTQNELLSNGSAAISSGVVTSDGVGLTVDDTMFSRTELGAYLTAVAAGTYTVNYAVALNDTGGSRIYRDVVYTVEA